MVVGHREHDSNELEMRRCLSYRTQEWRVDVMDFHVRQKQLSLFVLGPLTFPRQRTEEGEIAVSPSSGRTTISMACFRPSTILIVELVISRTGSSVGNWKY